MVNMRVTKSKNKKVNIRQPRQGKRNPRKGRKMPNNDVLVSFVHKYKEDFEAYSRMTQITESECREVLAASAIPAIITSRTKEPESLLSKLRSRHLDKKKNYKTEDDIREDLVDLVGVRIALYFPNQEEIVSGLLGNTFSNSEIKLFPDPVTLRDSSSPYQSQQKQDGQGQDSTPVRL